jgi:hypothetical protein
MDTERKLLPSGEFSEPLSVRIKSSRGTDSKSKNPEGKGGNGDNFGELKHVYRILDAPLITALESILWRSHFGGKRERKDCLNDFRNRHSKVFWFVASMDIFVARFTFTIIGLSVLTRGIGVHPIDLTMESLVTITSYLKLIFS